jgi:hypothetical protein
MAALYAFSSAKLASPAVTTSWHASDKVSDVHLRIAETSLVMARL